MSTELFTAIDKTKPVYTGPELLVLENYIDKKTCEKWVDFAEQKSGVSAPVGSTKVSGRSENTQNQGFVADRINLMSEPVHKLDATNLYKEIYGEHIPKHYGVEMEWFEIPHILRYKAGGNYNYHSDSEAWNDQQKRWVKGVDRDYSCVTYLNSNFTGGTLAFPHLNLRLHPREGLIVVFPSDHRFLHSAEETLTGKRYAMVTWGARYGSERVMLVPPPHIVRLRK